MDIIPSSNLGDTVGTLSSELSSLLRDVEVRKLDEEGALPWLLTAAPLN